MANRTKSASQDRPTERAIHAEKALAGVFPDQSRKANWRAIYTDGLLAAAAYERGAFAALAKAIHTIHEGRSTEAIPDEDRNWLRRSDVDARDAGARLMAASVLAGETECPTTIAGLREALAAATEFPSIEAIAASREALLMHEVDRLAQRAAQDIFAWAQTPTGGYLIPGLGAARAERAAEAAALAVEPFVDSRTKRLCAVFVLTLHLLERLLPFSDPHAVSWADPRLSLGSQPAWITAAIGSMSDAPAPTESLVGELFRLVARAQRVVKPDTHRAQGPESLRMEEALKRIFKAFADAPGHALEETEILRLYDRRGVLPQKIVHELRARHSAWDWLSPRQVAGVAVGVFIEKRVWVMKLKQERIRR